MYNLWKKITAGVLATGLALGCGGCGSKLPEEVVPTHPRPTVNNDPFTPVTANGGPASPHLLKLDNLAVAPEYPDIPRCPQEEDYPENSQQYYEDWSNWNQSQREFLVDSPENAHELDPFLEAAMKQFLSGPDNQVCAPLNIYFALAMLAETADGNSRQQILNVLGHHSIEELRAQAKQLWLAHYWSDGETVSLMANSIWLDDAYSFKESGLFALGEHYYTSVFNGDLGTPEMNQQLAQWLDSQTGNLLTEYTKEIQMDPATVFALASTAYFRASWQDRFGVSRTEQNVFHAKDQDVNTDFMHKSMMSKTYYWDDDFAAIQLPLTHSHKMWLILPDEGSSPQKLLEQGDYYNLISAPGNWEQKKELTVNLSMPKFDVDSQQNLIPGLKAMGITDVFNPDQANFGSITQEPVYVSDTQHTARVAVDEDGVVAAAYTLMLACGSAMPMEQKEIDFVLDRPFLFAITSKDNLPLFAGVVAEP